MVKRFKPKREYGFDTKLKRILDQKTEEFNEIQRGGKVRTAKYASDFGQCMRKVWYQFFPDEYPPSDVPGPRVLRIFHNGEDVHERLSKYLRLDASLDFHDEVDVPRDDLDVHGRCDGRCRVDDRAVVTEFKSINKGKVYEPKDEHVGQVSWYMHMFKVHRDRVLAKFGLEERHLPLAAEDVERYTEQYELTDVEVWLLTTQGDVVGEIVYESKQTQETFHFPIDYDESRIQRVRLWFEQLQWFIDNRERPHERHDKTKFPCQWGRGSEVQRCPFYAYCHGGVD